MLCRAGDRCEGERPESVRPCKLPACDGKRAAGMAAVGAVIPAWRAPCWQRGHTLSPAGSECHSSPQQGLSVNGLKQGLTTLGQVVLAHTGARGEGQCKANPA